MRLPVEPLTRFEVEQLLKGCSRTAPSGIRNRAIITTIHRCGLRCDEVLSLTLRDLNLEASELRVRHGKNDKSRVVGVSPITEIVLSTWLDVRETLPTHALSPLFCTLEGGPIDSSYLRHLFKRLGRKAGITKRVHPHGLRHTFAHELDAEGVPLTAIRDALGHSSVATTDTYLRTVNGGEAVRIMKGRE